MKILKYLTILALAILSGCNGGGGSGESGGGSSSVETRTGLDYSPRPIIVRNESVPSNGTRIIFLHGLSGTYDGYLAPNGIPMYVDFFKRLTDDGYEILFFNYKSTVPSLFTNDGLEYRRYFEALLDEMIRWSNNNHGIPKKWIIGGWSLGGLHTLMALALRPNFFEGGFGVLPVTDIKAVNEFRMVSANHFNPLNEIQTLKNERIMLAWGNRDDRVDYRLTIQLRDELLQAGSTSIQGIEYPGLDHSAGIETIADAEAFIRSL